MIYFQYICGEIGGYLSTCTSSISLSGVEEPGNEAMQQLIEKPLVSFPDYFSAEKSSENETNRPWLPQIHKIYRDVRYQQEMIPYDTEYLQYDTI